MQRPERHRIGGGARERVAVDLADRRRHRTELGLHARWKVGVAQLLQNPLASGGQLDSVVERERDEGQPEQRDAAEPKEPGRAVQRPLDRDRDPPLDLLRGLSGEPRYHLHLRVGRVRERLDREIAVGEIADHREQDREDERREPVLQRVGEQRVEHMGAPSYPDRASGGGFSRTGKLRHEKPRQVSFFQQLLPQAHPSSHRVACCPPAHATLQFPLERH